MKNFKVGDRVKFKFSMGVKEGDIIKIVGGLIGVSFENWFDGHNCDMYPNVSNCWWCSEYELEYAGEPPTKEEILSIKIRAMYKRRKDMGYKF